VIGSVLVSVHGISPRRTSCMAAMVGFIDTGRSTERAPPWSCRARRADTTTKRYVLPSGSSGIVLRERCSVFLIIALVMNLVLALNLHKGKSTTRSNTV
jgi:hypothetical protein